jgi:hypothetical protein
MPERRDLTRARMVIVGIDQARAARPAAAARIDVGAARLNREVDRHVDVARQRKRRAVHWNRREAHLGHRLPVFAADDGPGREVQLEPRNVRGRHHHLARRRRRDPHHVARAGSFRSRGRLVGPLNLHPFGSSGMRSRCCRRGPPEAPSRTGSRSDSATFTVSTRGRLAARQPPGTSLDVAAADFGVARPASA